MTSESTPNNWENFYQANAPPANYDESKRLLDEFCLSNSNSGNRIVLVTSGGTSVPLEHNTVRFIDNFSQGTRGAASAEHFLEKGYAVIFLHRKRSLQPFSRHFDGENFMDFLESPVAGNSLEIKVKPEMVSKVALNLEKFRKFSTSNMFLSITFTSLVDYLWLLRLMAKALSDFGSNAILFLAAAVSDFYIPSEEMSTHKIHSDDPLQLKLTLVPKMLKPLVMDWAPQSYVVSFKLETNSSILISKARKALFTYGHKLVIANSLNTRKLTVTLVDETTEFAINLSPEDIAGGIEIEQYIVDEIIRRHNEFIGNSI